MLSSPSLFPTIPTNVPTLVNSTRIPLSLLHSLLHSPCSALLFATVTDVSSFSFSPLLRGPSQVIASTTDICGCLKHSRSVKKAGNGTSYTVSTLIDTCETLACARYRATMQGMRERKNGWDSEGVLHYQIVNRGKNQERVRSVIHQGNSSLSFILRSLPLSISLLSPPSSPYCDRPLCPRPLLLFVFRCGTSFQDGRRRCTP